MVAVDHAPVTADELLAQIGRMVPPHLQGDVMGEATRGLDFSYTDPAAGRFRCSAFSHARSAGHDDADDQVATIPSLEALHLPTAVMDIALSQRGLTLVTGTTGSGKSTTLAAMIDLINTNYDVKIITVEDPIEYLHDDKHALIAQFEVGTRQRLVRPGAAAGAAAGPGRHPGRRAARRRDAADGAARGGHRAPGVRDRPRRPRGADDRAHHRDVPAGRAQGAARRSSRTPGGDHLAAAGRDARRDGGGRRPAIEILRGGPVTEKYILEGKLDAAERIHRRRARAACRRSTSTCCRCTRSS